MESTKAEYSYERRNKTSNPPLGEGGGGVSAGRGWCVESRKDCFILQYFAEVNILS